MLIIIFYWNKRPPKQPLKLNINYAVKTSRQAANDWACLTARSTSCNTTMRIVPFEPLVYGSTRTSGVFQSPRMSCEKSPKINADATEDEPLVNVEETFVVTGSKSPWGVMRFSVDLHIPYLSSSKSPWGVMSPVDWACSICFSSSKSPWGVMSCNYVQCGRIVHKFQIPMRGYEHDCSVRMAEVPQFQIPRRGYEDFYFTHNFRTSAVPNPHEGLWGLFRFRSIKHTASSKSPWGVMRRRSEFLDHATKVFQIPMRGYEDWSA